MVAFLDLVGEVTQICGKQQTAHIFVVNDVSIALTISVRYGQGLHIERAYAIFVPYFEDIYAIKPLRHTLARINFQLVFEGIWEVFSVVLV